MAKPDSNSTVRLARPDEAAAAAIWREVALWLIELGQPLWSLDQFEDAAIADLARADQVALGFDSGDPVAVMTIQDDDRLFWPETAPRSALLPAQAGGAKGVRWTRLVAAFDRLGGSLCSPAGYPISAP